MKPALSVLLFTVASGAGLGLLALLALFDLAGMASGAPALSPPTPFRALLTGIALTILGLCASTLHLANPRNAWRSFTRFRTSWLSREAVFALLLLGVAMPYGWTIAIGDRGGARAILAIATCLLAWTVLVCTAMIYASLKPIPRWHTGWTPATYLALGHWTGALWLVALAHLGATIDTSVEIAAGALGLVALVVKIGYWQHVARSPPVTLEDAIGVARGVRPPGAPGATVMRARLLDTGHTHGTFLTQEFGYSLHPAPRLLARAAFVVLGVLYPLAWIVTGETGLVSAILAVASSMIGVFAERWLFFAEARHTVRLYHGEART